MPPHDVPAPRRAGLLPAAVLALACAGLAATPPGDTLAVPADHATVQAAVDAAAPGDTILVAPGVHAGPIVLDKAVRLVSHFALTGDAASIAATVLDGGGGSSVIAVPPGTPGPPVVRGFTIRNASDGIAPRAPVNVLDCVISGTGDGIDFEDGSGGLVKRCTLAENSDDGIDLDDAVSAVIVDNDIRDNGDDGIEIRMPAHDGPLLQVLIARNRLHGNGEDGIQLIHYGPATQRVLEIRHNTIADNRDAGIGMMDNAETEEDFRAADIPETVLVIGNTFLRNDHGLSGGDAAVVVNNLFVGHTTLAVKHVDGASALAYNLFHGNAVDAVGSNLDTPSTLQADPLLTDALALAEGSPAIDAGTASFSWQGGPVLTLPPGSYAGAAPDLGAHEFQPDPGAPPAAPVLLAPADGATGVATTLLLDWQGDGTQYALQIAADAAFAAIVHASVGPASRHVVPAGVLQPSTTYHWRVGALDAAGRSAFSPVHAFTTAP